MAYPSAYVQDNLTDNRLTQAHFLHEDYSAEDPIGRSSRHIGEEFLSGQLGTEYKNDISQTVYRTDEVATGIPSKKSLLSWKDIAALGSVTICLIASALAVYSQKLAVQLGQTNQLIIVGLCLAVMAMGMHRQVRLASIMYEAWTMQLSVQSFEALLCMDMFARKAGYRAPAIVTILTVLPLTLSVGYKQFIGGTSSVEVGIPGNLGTFGTTFPPGYQRVGLGMTVSVQQYLPFWLDPQFNAAYGFSLFIHSNTTAAVLDAPSPNFFNSLQRSLRGEDFLLLSARVNATVSENIPFNDYDRTAAGWDKIRAEYDDWNWNVRDMAFGHYVLFANGEKAHPFNHSRTIVSIWQEPRNQTAQSEARQLFTTRREAYGTWKITSSNFTLHSARLLPMTAAMRTPLQQKIIQDNQIAGQNMLLQEFDYIRYPRARNVDTTPALVATSLWPSTAVCNLDDPQEGCWHWTFMIAYKPAREIKLVRHRVTLRRDYTLLVVLLITPVLTIAATVVKLMLYRCPIDDGVGLVSVLAAVEDTTLSVLRGAGLSGNLERSVQMSVAVESDKIVVRLDEKIRSESTAIVAGRKYA